MKKSGARHGQSASELISKRIAELGDWCGETRASEDASAGLALVSTRLASGSRYWRNTA
jgi:hypothetical protein